METPEVPTPGDPNTTRPVAHRAPPPRPEFTVTPLREEPTEATPRAVTVARSAWYASFAVLGGLAAVTALELASIRDGMSTALQEQSPDVANHDIADTVSATLLVSAGVAAILLVTALVFLHLLGQRRRIARIALAATGAASVAAAVAYRGLTADAGVEILQWAPFVYAGLVVVAVAALFMPSVNNYLRR
ncbi:hypothetical protein [Rhodococcus kronopolitis]|uniref:DUF2567 domain-containing protein n=1 Tax=Rhodococcus kronopolitis TaxID=1460226 RepID=A0ABV9FWI8_9NOCA